MRRRVTCLFGITVALVAAIVLWTMWAESHPGAERDLRLVLRERLDDWFPKAMAPQQGWHGLMPVQKRSQAVLTVLLVHGLDEPGGIWEDLEAVLQTQPYNVHKLRYPNDQAISRSTRFLADVWTDLPTAPPVVLIGHSMGGLVIRDFVSAHRHPVDQAPEVSGPPVRGVILVGTPNHGSEWARLRIWLELKDHFSAPEAREFSLFAALRDGLGTAKVDLRPGSAFLRQLNQRPWPDCVERRLIAGVLLNHEDLKNNVERLAARAPDTETAEAFLNWWENLEANLGDGVVTLDAVVLDDAPQPEVLTASHRGLLRAGAAAGESPPAIPLILKWLDTWAAPPGPSANR